MLIFFYFKRRKGKSEFFVHQKEFAAKAAIRSQVFIRLERLNSSKIFRLSTSLRWHTFCYCWCFVWIFHYFQLSIFLTIFYNLFYFVLFCYSNRFFSNRQFTSKHHALKNIKPQYNMAHESFPVSVGIFHMVNAYFS